MVVDVGETVLFPLTETFPNCGIEQEVAFCEFQLKVELCPAWMLEGEAEIFTVGLACWQGGVVKFIMFAG